MGIPVSDQPPVIFQTQDQNQDQNQNQNQGDVILNDTSNNESESRSRSENVNNLSGELSNVQINNNIDSYVQFEGGVRIPTTTFNLSAYGNRTSTGVQATISIPIGGGKKLAKRQVNSRIAQIDHEVVARKLETCANIGKAGFTITNYEALNLDACKYMTRTQRIAQATDDVQEMRKAIRDQQVLIQKLLHKIDMMETEKGNPFNSPG